MKNTIRLFAILFIALWLAVIAANAQKVVDQKFIDDANTAFVEVVALRKLAEAYEERDAAQQKLILTLEDRDKAKNELLANVQAENKRLREVTCTKSSFLLFVYRSKKCF